MGALIPNAPPAGNAPPPRTEYQKSSEKSQGPGAGLGYYCPASPSPNFNCTFLFCCWPPALLLVSIPFGFGTHWCGRRHMFTRPHALPCPVACTSLWPTHWLPDAAQPPSLLSRLLGSRLTVSLMVTFIVVPAGCSYLSAHLLCRDRFSHLLSPCWSDPWEN